MSGCFGISTGKAEKVASKTTYGVFARWLFGVRNRYVYQIIIIIGAGKMDYVFRKITKDEFNGLHWLFPDDGQRWEKHRA